MYTTTNVSKIISFAVLFFAVSTTATSATTSYLRSSNDSKSIVGHSHRQRQLGWWGDILGYVSTYFGDVLINELIDDFGLSDQVYVGDHKVGDVLELVFDVNGDSCTAESAIDYDISLVSGLSEISFDNVFEFQENSSFLNFDFFGTTTFGGSWTLAANFPGLEAEVNGKFFLGDDCTGNGPVEDEITGNVRLDNSSVIMTVRLEGEVGSWASSAQITTATIEYFDIDTGSREVSLETTGGIFPSNFDLAESFGLFVSDEFAEERVIATIVDPINNAISEHIPFALWGDISI